MQSEQQLGPAELLQTTTPRSAELWEHLPCPQDVLETGTARLHPGRLESGADVRTLLFREWPLGLGTKL